MNKKDKRDKDDSRKDFSEEYRSVRFYSNIDGVEKEYGYDYKRDAEGKEEYRELGEIPEEFGKEFIDRVHNLDRSFDWNRDFFTRSFDRFSEIFPSFGRLMGDFGRPSLLPGSPEPTEVLQPEVKQDYEVAYDLQVDKENNELYLIVELPGYAKEDVNLKLLKQDLHLIADNGKKVIDTKIPIKYSIERDEKISATMKHGILEVKIKLLDTENGDETDITIN